MKNIFCLLSLLLFPLTAQAATYYIDCAGLNTNTGADAQHPWANTTPIQGKNFLKPGDKVEVKSGCTWTGPSSHVIIDSAGAAANPIIVEAYGGGADPIFDASVVPAAAVPNWTGWTVYNAANHVYVSNVTVPWVVNTIVVDGASDLRGLNPGNQNVTTLNSEPGSFFTLNAVNNKIYIRLSDSSDPNTHQLRFGRYTGGGHDRGLFSVMDDSTQYVTVRHMHLIGSNAQGFTSGAPYVRFEDCLSEFSARESFYIVKNVVQNSTGAAHNTLLRCTGTWANSNFGQNFTIESSHVDLIDSTAAYGWMAGIDWLDYNSQTDASFGRCVRCTSHDNGQRSYNHDPNGYDPQIYIDGGHDIQIIDSNIYMSLAGFYNNNANSILNISFGTEHPDIKPDYNNSVINSRIHGSNYMEFGTGALYKSAHTTMQAVDNVTLIGNTFVRTGGYQILGFGNLETGTTAKGIFLYNNIFYNPAGSTTGYAPPIAVTHSDNNLYYNFVNQVYNNYSLAQWQTASGQDKHSIFSNPDFVSEYHLQNKLSGNALTSPAVDAGDGSKLTALSIFSNIGSTMTNNTLDDPNTLDIGYHYGSLVAGVDTNTPSLPVVAITSPASASSFSAGANVTITVTASETNGSIKNISLYNGSGILLGSSSTSPFNFIYTNILPGTYTFSAQATDVNGVSSTSKPITVSVTLPAPAGLSDSLGVGTPEVQLTWSPSAGASYYNVKRATVSGGPYTFIGDGGGTTFPDSTVSYGITYYYVVSAVSPTFVESPNSTQLIVKMPALPAPSTPIGLSASAGNAQVQLTWASSTAATSYNLKRATTSGGPYTTIASSVTTTFYTDASASNNTTYYYVVSAVNSVGQSPNSAQVSATPEPPPLPPSAPTGIKAAAGNALVALTWTPETGNSIYYIIKRSTVSGGPYTVIADGGSTSFDDYSVSNGTTYYYVVSAANPTGQSPNSAQVSVTTPTAPVIKTQPLSVTTMAGSTATFSVVATGTPVPTYQWFSSVNGGPFTAMAGQTNASRTTAALTTANSGNKYECVVTNIAGSVTSNVATLTVHALPVVSISSPVNGSGVTAGSNLTITANASESNGTIVKVEFYNGSTLLGTDTVSPYTYTLNNVIIGNYTLKAIAYDNNSHQTTSTAVAVKVSGLPTISLAANKTSAITPATIVLTATVAENNGTITKVSFYNGTTLVGTTNTAPYTFNWGGVVSGNYTVHAVVQDANGKTATSNSIKVSVTSWPMAYITSPGNGGTFTAGSNITITAQNGEANGTITQLWFYNGNTLLGTVNNPPSQYRYTWINVPAGTYSFNLRAKDAKGIYTQSGVVKIIVKAPVAKT